MTWDSVPWFVGGGAQHSPEVARLLAYAATSGAQGIVAPGDLKVAPLAVPGASVRVLAGAALILNRAAGGAQQTYVGRNPSEDVKGIAATGSGSGRNDLVIAQIKDPFLAGESWADPADVTVGPYIFTEVIPNVPTGDVANNTTATAYLKAQGISGIPLAAVLLPASTATITSGLIRDLRAPALPRERRYLRVTQPPALQSIHNGDWFRAGSYTPTVPTPSWATHVSVLATLSSVEHKNGQAIGDWRISFGGALFGPLSIYDVEGTSVDRATYVVAAEFAIPDNLKGTDTQVGVDVRRNTAFPGNLTIMPQGTISLDVQFSERAV